MQICSDMENRNVNDFFNLSLCLTPQQVKLNNISGARVNTSVIDVFTNSKTFSSESILVLVLLLLTLTILSERLPTRYVALFYQMLAVRRDLKR